MSISVLSIRVDVLSRDEIRHRFESWLLGDGQHHVVTLNPEMVMWAQKDSAFLKIVNTSALVTVDGAGVAFAARFLSGTRVARYTGYEVFYDVLRIAEREGKSVFLLGGADQHVAYRTAQRVKNQFPSLRVAGAASGPHVRLFGMDIDVDPEEQTFLLHYLNETKPDILFVAFGHPKQEKWIASALTRMPTVKVAVGVGGVFNYVSGMARRAPGWMRALGLEWLFRLFKEPRRLPRIITATVRFSLAVFHEWRRANKHRA